MKLCTGVDPPKGSWEKIAPTYSRPLVAAILQFNIAKVADDTYLLVAAANSTSVPCELQHISQWAGKNNLKLNTSKSCEMIIHQSSTKILNYPPVHPDLKRVEQITALDVTFNNTLSCGPHVYLITAKTAASLYVLKTSGAMDWMAMPYGVSRKLPLSLSCYMPVPSGADS